MFWFSVHIYSKQISGLTGLELLSSYMLPWPSLALTIQDMDVGVLNNWLFVIVAFGRKLLLEVFVGLFQIEELKWL